MNGEQSHLPEDQRGEGFALFRWASTRGPKKTDGISDLQYSHLAQWWWITGGWR